MQHRLPALDWMRGIVMLLMATDHASEAFNASRPTLDSILFGKQVALDPLQFAHRWLSHLCAPTFLFLAGTSLALSINRRIHRGASPGSIDRDLLVRGLIVFGVDLLFINWFWSPGFLVLQVMTAIGLAIGIPTLVAYNLLAAKSDALVAEIEAHATQLISNLRGGVAGSVKT